VFIKKYIQRQRHKSEQDQTPLVLPNEEFLRHKKYLYKFFDNVTDKISDYKIWRLIGRIKGTLQEPIEEVKQLKLKEIRSLMKINW